MSTSTARTRARQVQADQAAADVVAPPPALVVEDGGTKRQTVDLTTRHHHEFARWRMETAVAQGQTRLTTQEALAGLVALLLTDETVSRRAQAKIAELAAKRKATGDT